MYLQWQTQFMKDGDSLPFKFNGTFTVFSVGISSFVLIYPLGGNASLNVQNMGVSATGQQTGVDTVNVQLKLHLDDAGGNTFDPENSGVYVTVLAFVGESPANIIYLGRSPDVSQQDRETDFGSNSIAFCASFLSSFKLAFQTAQPVKEIYTNINSTATPAGSGVDTSGKFYINNGSGMQSTAEELIGGIIAILEQQGSNIELQVVDFTNSDSGKSSATATFNKDVTGVIAFIQNFDLVFKNSTTMSGIVAGLQFDANVNPVIVINPDNKKEVTFYNNTSIFDLANNTAVTTNTLKLLAIATTS